MAVVDCWPMSTPAVDHPASRHARPWLPLGATLAPLMIIASVYLMRGVGQRHGP
jgi:hypothetical protein